MSEKIREAVEKKYREDSRRLALYWPAETITLLEAARGRKEVRLHSGDAHVFDEEEVSRLLNLVPLYYWELMRLPIMLRYRRREDGISEYVVEGGVWQRRLVELITKGDVTSEGAESLNVYEFASLIKSFKSLVFVTLAVE
ncbi:MAG: DUF61 family protein [Thermoprotei archaeon]|nr:DUF61 family protein [Thermoprotei archaeon]